MSRKRVNDALRRLARRVTQQLGIRMPNHRHHMLEWRLQRRMRALRISSVPSYERHLDSPDGVGELQHFYDVVTTNKTDFFREIRHYKFLLEVVVPEFEQSHPGPNAQPFRIWSAGCSTGEEPYSLAMALSEYARERPEFSFTILATDISSHVLRRAMIAVYDEETVAAVDPELRKRYLLRSKDSSRGLIKIAPEIRSLVQFMPLNFMERNYPIPGPFDAIFFRNVLIYFDKPTQETVVRRQCAHLKPTGYLFVGHAETLIDLQLPLVQVSQSVYRKHS